jgi:hypothetical protein
MSSALVYCVGESVVANTSNGISMHVQRKSTGNLIQDSAFMIEILTGIKFMWIRNAFYNMPFGVVEGSYVPGI